MKKAIIYIDGYNFYFSLKENSWKKYYWVDVRKLSDTLLRPGHILHKIKYFTARVKKPTDKTLRQNAFLEATQSLKDLEIIYGRYQYNTKNCFKCGHEIPDIKEKKTDVNIATQMIFDAVKKNCDVQYLLSGDSDIVPAINVIKDLFPERKIFLICPPKPVQAYNKRGELEKKRYRVSNELIKICNDHTYITESVLQKSMLPNPVRISEDREIKCPAGWYTEEGAFTKS